MTSNGAKTLVHLMKRSLRIHSNSLSLSKLSKSYQAILHETTSNKRSSGNLCRYDRTRRLVMIIGGSERATDYDFLLEQIRNHGLDEKEYSWYLDLRKIRFCSHSGFGLGANEQSLGLLVSTVCVKLFHSHVC